MKYLYLLCTICLLITTAAAQDTTSVIPNADFENWENLGLYEEPVSWNTINGTVIIPLVQGPNTTRTAGIDSGTLAVRMVTITNALDDTYPGVLSNGTITMVPPVAGWPTYSGGSVYGTRPSSLMGHYKYSPSGTDTCLVSITLMGVDSSGNDTLVARAEFTSGDSAGSFLTFRAVFIYVNNLVPTTMLISMSSSKSAESASAGSTFIVDRLSVDFGAGVGLPLGFSNEVSIYPNPANDRIVVKLNSVDDGMSLVIYDLTGVAIKGTDVFRGTGTMDIAGLLPGSYIVGLFNKQQQLVGSGRFAVAK